MKLIRAFLACVMFILAPCGIGGVALNSTAQAKEHSRHIAYFSYGFELWETDGTLSGTFRIDGPSGSGSFGLPPSYLTPFGNKLLFQGVDNENGTGLWVTDGAAAGTYEVGGANDAAVSGAYSGGLFPSSPPASYPTKSQFVTFGTKALFYGEDSSRFSGLWVTDGTAAGTTEIGGLGNKGIAGQYFAGLQPSGFGAAGDKVFFSAMDTYDYRGLWVTDGSAAGTVEIGGLRNAGIKGAAAAPNSFSPDTFTPFGNKMLFKAYDSLGNYGLWITNGTAAGTTEISYLVNGGYYFTVLGSKVFFTDSVGGLWVTDGTAAGTVEIRGVKGEPPEGFAPTFLTTFGDKLLFNGFDSAGTLTLWVTDGTAGGTTEPGGLMNAGVRGVALGGLNPLSGGSIGSKALFTGTDASNQSCLWVTDGTPARLKSAASTMPASKGRLRADSTLVTSLGAAKKPFSK